jgi:hypothetical protein
MKCCKDCGVQKPLSDFYAAPSMSDGHAAACKDCYKKAVKANRAAKLEKYQAYDRARTDDPDRVALRARIKAERAADPARAAVDTQQKYDWAARNREKRRAQNMASNAIRDGKLVAPAACERCGKIGQLHAHHEDYSKPLEVTWLCPPCHGARHRELNAALREAA